MTDLDPKSEIALRADEIRAAAKDCVIVLDLARKLNWPITSAARANEALDLGLPVQRPDRIGWPRPAQAVPKPAGKAKKGAGE